jgi:catechol 2,3-dioxygenase-like lactoylglutathione lyase family enzyme
MAETTRFWRDLLGMRVVAALGGRGFRQYFFEVSDLTIVSFFEWPGAEPIAEKDAGRAVTGPVIFDHICIEVEDADALWALKDKLDAAEVWVSEVIDNGFIHSIFTFDPNGISLEFCYAVEGMDLRKTPVLADPEPLDAVTPGGRTRIGRVAGGFKPNTA